MEQLFSSVFKKFKELNAHDKPVESILLETSELLRSEIPHYDWVGFYLFDKPNNMLVLGPYTGKATEHTHIPVGKGICGQVAENRRSMIVQDVTQQDNYIACSVDVQSEIVVPILKNGLFVAEIDIDSHAYAPFSNEDEQFLSAIAAELASYF
jgi:L-methionine (R)-S-oxide reductase